MSAPASAARAIRRRIERDRQHASRELRYAVVQQTDPLRARLADGKLPLDEEDLVLGQWLRRYRDEVGFVAGDTLAVTSMGNGDWLATDVLATGNGRNPDDVTYPGGGDTSELGDPGPEWTPIVSYGPNFGGSNLAYRINRGVLELSGELTHGAGDNVVATIPLPFTLAHAISFVAGNQGDLGFREFELATNGQLSYVIQGSGESFTFAAAIPLRPA